MLTYFPDAELDQALVANNGKQLTMPDGTAVTLRVNIWNAIYPYKHQVIRAMLDPVNKQAESYQKTRRELGDDWSTDLLESGEDIQNHIFAQLGL